MSQDDEVGHSDPPVAVVLQDDGGVSVSTISSESIKEDCGFLPFDQCNRALRSSSILNFSRFKKR